MISKYITCLGGILLFLLTGSLIRVGHAQSPPLAEIRRQFPYAELASDHIELGTFPRGSSKTGSLSLSNTGSHPLLIATVRSSCGLLIPSWPGRPIDPGQTVHISFRYDASRLGPFERIITIHTNAWQKTLKVSVKGHVTDPTAVLPH